MRYRKPARENYIRKGSVRYADKRSSAVVYAYELSGKFILLGFSGKRQKPDFHYSYPTQAKREAKAVAFFESVCASEAFRLELREKRLNRAKLLTVGSILKCSWGYDQTNIDYFEVTKLIGKSMCEIRELKQASRETGSLYGKCVPLPGDYAGPPMRKRIDGDSVRIYSFASAFLVEPTMVGGVPTYAASNWSAYA